MATDHERLDDLRRDRGPIPEHVIDEYLAGRISRRDFIRRGAMVGLSLPVVGGILAACGSTSSSSTPSSTTKTSATSTKAVGKAGATITAGTIVPTSTPNPLLVDDTGGIDLLNQVGEMLVFYDNANLPRPWLATSWSSNSAATVWTLGIRRGVKFSNGQPMTVDDVVYSFETQPDPRNNSNALSVFGGSSSPPGW